MNIQSLRCDFATPTDPTGKTVVVLHGRGDSAAGFHWMPEFMKLSGVSYLFANAPDPWFEGFSWYDMPPNHGPGVVRSRACLDELFAELQAHGIRPQDIVLFGFSQGCLLTLEWGARTELPLAGCIGVSGYCYDADALARELADAARTRPWLITHGTQDDVVPYDRTAQQMQHLIAAGLPVDFRTYRKPHTISFDLRDIRAAFIQMLDLET